MKEVREQITSYLGAELGKQIAGGPKALQWTCLGSLKNNMAASVAGAKGERG